ncbi:Holliday junction resolvase [compost metagenome]
MVARLLALPGLPGSDAADALGVAICHANSHDALALISLAGGTAASPLAGLRMRRGRLVD